MVNESQLSCKKLYLLLFSFLILFIFALAYPSGIRAVNISSPTVYDCNNATVTNITVKNTHDVTIKNCKVSGASSTGILITDSSFVTIQNVSVTKVGALSGAISFDNVHDLVVEDFQIIGGGSMGWAFSGPVTNFTIRRGTITGVGQAASVQTHGMYIANWHNFLIEDVVIDKSYNTGIKIVEDTDDGIVRRVTIKNSGASGVSGSAVMMGDGRASDIKRIKFESCLIINNLGGIYGYDSANNITIEHNTFVNNSAGVWLNAGATGWVVKNNITVMDQGVVGTGSNRIPLELLGGDNDITRNTFDNNVWRFTNGSSILNPIRLNTTTYSLASWQAKPGHPDGSSIGADPQFISSTDFHLKSASPACSMGAFPCGGSPNNPIPTNNSKSGDVNGDGAVNLIDIGILIDSYGKSTSIYPKSDLNSDNIINIVDIGIVISYYGK